MILSAKILFFDIISKLFAEKVSHSPYVYPQ